MKLHQVHKVVKHGATKLRHHPAFHPCQGLTQLGILAMQIERSSWAEVCLIGGALTMTLVALFSEAEKSNEIPEF